MKNYVDWHEQYTAEAGVHPWGEPRTVVKWRPITAARADWMTRRGLGCMVRIGRPDFNAKSTADAARAAAREGL